MKCSFILVFVYAALVLYNPVHSQQVADNEFNPPIVNPQYEKGEGPVVFIDEGHFNFHTKDGRYSAFARLLERDGYIVKAYEETFVKGRLAKGKILVISNALHESDQNEWVVPNPSAFSSMEIQQVKEWVSEGGNLFLLADHMPMAGAASELAAVFGFEFTNGFVFEKEGQIPTLFSIAHGSLIESAVTNGRSESERIDDIATFTGQAFNIPPDAIPVLKFSEGFVNVLPDTAWVFKEHTKKTDPVDMYQGAYLKHGKGRVAIFGEAAMFSAQLAGKNKVKMGMNHVKATRNYQLLLNIIHWLDGHLD